MKFLNQEQARRICERAMSFTRADECVVKLDGERTGNIRYARNTVSTAGVADDVQLRVQVAYGKRQGTATINEFDDKSLERVVRRAEELARSAPENPEFMPAVGKQAYKSSATFSARTAAIDPEQRAQAAAYSIEASRKNKLLAAGFFTDSSAFHAVANSNGAFGYSAARSTSPAPCVPRTGAGRAGSSARPPTLPASIRARRPTWRSKRRCVRWTPRRLNRAATR